LNCEAFEVTSSPPSDSPPNSVSQTARTGSSDALALTALAGEARPLVVFCARAAEASRLRDEIAWFDPKLKICVFPDWETLPYDSFSPHQDLVSERLATLYQIQRREFDVVVLPATTALQRLAPPEYSNRVKPSGWTRCVRNWYLPGIRTSHRWWPRESSACAVASSIFSPWAACCPIA
jgi:hypothetical protein